ncbi:MAG: hypothetical protein ACJ75B_03880 [Flavisolibacter sp.]|jgi:hypothetical protein
MKKFILSSLFSLLILGSFAQSEKYMSAMQDKVLSADTTRDVQSLKDLSASFERIADAEKTQWLPYYYAALTQVNAGYMIYVANQGNADALSQLDAIADRAEQLLSKAEAMTKDNSEIYVVKKMIATLRMMVSPQTRYMQYGPQAQQALETAKKLNPENPRVYYLEGLDKFQTPEQYGGSKTEAKKLFEEALQKFDAAKPATSIDPAWGRGATQYFLSQIK